MQGDRAGDAHSGEDHQGDHQEAVVGRLLLPVHVRQPNQDAARPPAAVLHSFPGCAVLLPRQAAPQDGEDGAAESTES